MAKTRAKSGPRRISSINSHPIPRRTTVLLCDETRKPGTVVGPVRESAVRLGRHVYVHRLVRVHLDGEETPRKFEYSRLAEFSAFDSLEEVST